MATRTNKTYQVWAVIRPDGQTSYSNKSHKDIKAGDVYEYPSGSMTMCRPGTLNSRFLKNALGRDNGAIAARVELKGHLSDGYGTFNTEKATILGVIKLDELREFIKPTTNKKPEPPLPSYPTMRSVFEKFHTENASYFSNRTSSRAIRDTMYQGWLELADIIERGETPGPELLYRVAYLTHTASLERSVDLHDWSTETDGRFEIRPELAVAAIKNGAERIRANYIAQEENERLRVAANSDPLRSMDTREVEIKAREFFKSKFPDASLKDNGLVKGEDALNPYASMTATT